MQFTVEATIIQCYGLFVKCHKRHISEKIKMQKVNGRQITEDGCQVMAKAHIAFGKVSY
jgi:hypothetical protein